MHVMSRVLAPSFWIQNHSAALKQWHLFKVLRDQGFLLNSRCIYRSGDRNEVPRNSFQLCHCGAGEKSDCLVLWCRIKLVVARPCFLRVNIPVLAFCCWKKLSLTAPNTKYVFLSPVAWCHLKIDLTIALSRDDTKKPKKSVCHCWIQRMPQCSLCPLFETSASRSSYSMFSSLYSAVVWFWTFIGIFLNVVMLHF